MATFDNIGLAEPSTITKVVAAVVVPRGSTNEYQEILVVGDPQSSLGVARVLAAAPASTEFGLVVRIAGGPSSVVDLTVRAALSSTTADNPVSATQVGTWTHTFLAGNISSAAQTGNSSGLTVRPVWSSSAVDQPVRALLSSTTADNPVSATQVGTWSVVFPAGYISSGMPAANSSGLLVRPVWSSTAVDQPVRAVLSSTTADNPVSATQVGTWTLTFPAGSISSVMPAANSSGLLVRPVWSSTAVDQPVRAVLSSTTADNPVSATQVGTWTVTPSYGSLQSSVAGSSGSSALLVRPIIDTILTVASTNAFVSSAFTIQSSAAGIRTYVVAYSILSTNAGPLKVKFFDGSSVLWPVIFAAVSSAVSGANLAVSAPAYLFRGSQANPMTIQTASSIAGVQLGVSYFRAP